MMRRLCALTLALTLAACAGYALVPANQPAVAARSLTVTPPAAWNRLPRGIDQLSQEENWTKNGAVLDSISFFGGLQSGAAFVRQRRREDQQVPVFRAGMAPPELIAMIESYYRVRGGVVQFTPTSVAPVDFLGTTGVGMDFDYLTLDDVKRKGRAVMAEVGGKLYLMTLDGTRSHYFDAARPDFDAMVASARVR